MTIDITATIITKERRVNNAYRTARTRKKLSAPSKYLLDNDLIKGKTLDYGCGKGFDADQCGWYKYDPHFHGDRPEGKFKTIVCNYVLNVVDELEEREIIADIISRLDRNGVAYLTVRRDIRKGVVYNDRLGTMQRFVNLDLPKQHRLSNRYYMYRLTIDNYRRLLNEQ
jgi:hypothetical protein